MILDALTYPFRRENAPILAVGAAVFSLLITGNAVLGLGLLGLLLLLLQILAVLYFAIFFQSVMEASAKGEDRVPAWPEESNGTDLIGSVFQILVPVILSFLPLIVLRVYWKNFGVFGDVVLTAMSILPGIGAISAFGRDVPVMPAGAVGLSYVLAALGFAYLPMALLVFSFHGESAVVNVVAVARSIIRIAGDYFLVVVVIVALFACLVFIGGALASLPALLRSPISTALLFYVMTVGMRAIGLLYARNRDRLGWEDGKPRVEGR